ncbi:tyrosine-type recombinase/integrase [Streptomyces sp. V4I2]|uniref:tyrosine-type recombinase/integrase n=1 Tax=Streptomyces sp. V4I2 TaxID=3042280 RepID=UPI0027D91F95|nr:site-specific integrase [Streptomyces sp. V4I2]
MTPHDFRRLFATDIVNGGLPIHIGAAFLGHLNLQTTQGYVDPRELHQMGENPQIASSGRWAGELQGYYELTA